MGVYNGHIVNQQCVGCSNTLSYAYSCGAFRSGFLRFNEFAHLSCGLPIAFVGSAFPAYSGERPMLRRILTIALVCPLLLAAGFFEPAKAQRNKVPKEPFQIVDVFTGQSIPEILVIPRYSSGVGIFIPPEGPSKSSVRNYLDNPFIYRAGEPFIIKQPKVFIGAPLLFVYIGEVRDLEGILVIAPGYHPLWTDDLWWYPGNPTYERKLALSPISDSGWSLLLEEELSAFLTGASRVNENCEIFHLPKKCNLRMKYNKKERGLVRSFLLQMPKRRLNADRAR